MLLLEEPELSLNTAIVVEIPSILGSVLRGKKQRGQILITTHSEALLSSLGIDGRGILLLEAGREGSHVRSVNAEEEGALRSGFSVAEVVLPRTRPAEASLMAMQF